MTTADQAQTRWCCSKTAIIQHLYGISSLRRTAEEISLNVAYRWFLGYSLMERTPHFTTLSNNFCHRFTEETVERVFNWILSEINKAGCLSPEAVFIDGTHIKANANMKKRSRKPFPKLPRFTANSFLRRSIRTVKITTGSRLKTTNRRKKRLLPNPRPTRSAEYFIRASTRNALPMPLRLPATKMDMCSM